MRQGFALRRWWFAVAVCCLLCTASWAQGNIRTIVLVRTKLNQTDSWKAAVKDLVALHQKAGVEQRFTVWESQTGPAQYAVVWYSQKWKDLGEDDPKLKSYAADVAKIFSRLDTVTDNIEVWVDEIQPDLSIHSDKVPPYVRTGRTRVVPGKMDDVKALFHESILPAVKKSGTTDFGFFVARFGTPNNEFHTYLGLNGWGDFDAPLGAEKGMSPAEYKAFLAKIATLTEGTQFDLWKYEPDLSYVPAAK